MTVPLITMDVDLAMNYKFRFLVGLRVALLQSGITHNCVKYVYIVYNIYY